MFDQFKAASIVLSFVVFLSRMGCAGKWGKIRPDADVTSSFEKFQINSDMEYYISGGDDYPTSILGLYKTYTLETDLWKKLEVTPKIFSYLVTNMQARLLTNSLDFQQGFAVLDNNGRQIGVWYSLLTGNIFVQIKDDNKVIIHPPADTVDYKRYEGRLGKSGS
jgi:hypothetical protein